MKNIFSIFHTTRKLAERKPDEPKHTLFIERNDRGGLSLRWDGDDEQLGNYATEADARRIAKLNFADVVVLRLKPTLRANQPELVS